MIPIKIKVPIWATKSVGVAEHKIIDDLAIEILYKNKLGDRVYPGIYTISKSKALSYPYQDIKGNRLRIIPIKDMEANL